MDETLKTATVALLAATIRNPKADTAALTREIAKAHGVNRITLHFAFCDAECDVEMMVLAGRLANQ